MKRKNLFRLLMVALFATMSLQLSAQGIFVNKKNGEIISYPKAIFDKVTPMTQGSKRGVDVWKTDGTKDSYWESELLSITTFEVDFDERITQDIPEEYLSKMSAYMPIYSGNTPPNVEGVYLLSPDKMIYNSNVYSSYQAGKVFADVIPEYTEQDFAKNTVKFRYQQRNSSGQVIAITSQEESKIMGEGENFTNFTIVRDDNSNGVTWSKIATILSGTKTSDGIKNLFYGILMLEKNDPNDQLMDVGDCRVFKDDDGMSPYDAWKARLKTDAPAGTKDLPCIIDEK